MLINARELADNSLIEADVVIIGAGIAGITIARELGQRAKTVCVLESGGKHSDARTQALCGGSGSLSVAQQELVNLDGYLLASRIRRFGGSGNIWGAKVSVLDAMDLEARPWVPHSGWPLDLAHLKPFYERTARLLKISPFSDLGVAGGDQERSPITELPNFEESIRQYTNLTGRKATLDYQEFKQSITDVPNIDVYLNANVVAIDLADHGEAVHKLRIACLNGKQHTARASTYILATGGLENARLLLSSNRIIPKGVGNEHNRVGRFFTGHLGFSQPDGGISFNCTEKVLERYLGYRGTTHSIISLSPLAQRERKVPQFGVYFTKFLEKQNAIDSSATQIAQTIDQALVPPPGPSGGLVGNFFGTEHLPNPESRVLLAKEKDELGVRRLELKWSLQQQDLVNLNRGIDLFSRDLGRYSQGRVKFGFDLADPGVWSDVFKRVKMSRHHIGTTRMHTDPKQGVVDINCRLHSVENMFIAGCSVFPTMGGLANPTFTIIALALRLSDRLKAKDLA